MLILSCWAWALLAALGKLMQAKGIFPTSPRATQVLFSKSYSAMCKNSKKMLNIFFFFQEVKHGILFHKEEVKLLLPDIGILLFYMIMPCGFMVE